MTEEKKTAGRPRKEINWTLFEDLCNLQCTQSEICSVLHIHDETLRFRVKDHYEEDYPVIYKRLSEGGKSSLRRLQFKLAHKNTSMAIFLGKQWLGQRDNDQILVAPPELADQFRVIMEQIANFQRDPALVLHKAS
jgi:hypothetical protein